MFRISVVKRQLMELIEEEEMVVVCAGVDVVGFSQLILYGILENLKIRIVKGY